MRKNITIPAFHETEMEKIFKKLGIWNKFVNGRMGCIICGKKLNEENFGALVPYKNTIWGACDGPCIYKAQRLIVEKEV